MVLKIGSVYFGPHYKNFDKYLCFIWNIIKQGLL